MKAKKLIVRSRASLAIAATTALMLSASAAAGETAAAPKPDAFESGAGPGWPATLSPSEFVARVDNPWFPLTPGSRYRYRGSKDGVATIDKVRVTHLTKTIEGVRTTVVHDQVLVHGRPEEVTKDFYAQDRDGNVWYFGENTKELDRNGHVTSREGSFKAGRDGAKAGLYFPADPKPGVSGRQEFYKGHAEDSFTVLDDRAHVSVPFVTTDKAVRTKEGTPLEPKTLDNKYYVRGVGTVREIAVKGPNELLELISFRQG